MMKLKSLLRHFSLVSMIACASTQPLQQAPIETVNVDVPLEVGLSFVPRLYTLRIDYRDQDGQPGLTSMEEIRQIIPAYGSVSGNSMPDPLSPEKAYSIYLMSKR
mgnify:FL=1